MTFEIREHTLTHFCMTSLNAGEIDLDDTLTVSATAGSHMNYKTTVEEHLIAELLPFASTASMAAELEWKEAWEDFGEDSGRSEYVPTPAEKFKWQFVETVAVQLGVGEQILLEFLANLDSGGIALHDFTVEWEDATDEHCRTFLLVSPEN